MEVIFARAGLLTTVQDLGRPGRRAEGIPVGGAMDRLALRVANLLVGNDEGAAGLEMTLVGPELVFSADALLAVGGAEFEGIPAWRPWLQPAGKPLRFGPCRRGSRGYLAVADGFEVEMVLGGRGTYLRGGFGGKEGRALQDGDRLSVAGPGRRVTGHWHLDSRILPAYAPDLVARVVPGAQAGDFAGAFLDVRFVLSPQSDRIGLRLKGASLDRKSRRERVSTAVAPGTIQVPSDGHPIVLMADARTLGGYPRVAHVIGADLPLLAQLRPGDGVRFREVTLDEAHRLDLDRERSVGMLRQGLVGKFAPPDNA